MIKQATFISKNVSTDSLTHGKTYEILDWDERKDLLRIQEDNGRMRWYPRHYFLVPHDPTQHGEITWIEAEHWVPGSWTPRDCNSDVSVTRADGSHWIASFFTYQNIITLVEKNKQTGECLNGTYFWSSDMILVDEVSRECIGQVIQCLLHDGTFEQVFTQVQEK